MGLSDNWVSFWELEEVSGTRVDQVTASGNDLTDNNTVTQGTGIVGNCGQFTRANSESLSRADNASLRFSGSWSTTSWHNKDSEPAGLIIFAKNNGAGAREMELGQGVNLGNDCTVNVWVGGVHFGVSTAQTILAGTWNHVVLSFDSTTHILSLYLNGGTALTVDVGAAAIDTSATADFVIGASGNTKANFFNGRIDQVGKRSGITTSAEVAQLYNSGAGLSWAAMTASAVAPANYSRFPKPAMQSPITAGRLL